MAEQLRKVLSDEHFNDFKMNVKRGYEELFHKITLQEMKRFDSLMQPHMAGMNVDVEKWIFNLSDVQLPWFVQNTLALGDKFNLPVRNDKIATEQFIANFEPKFQTLGKRYRVELRNRVCNILTNFKKSPTKRNTVDEIMKANHEATKTFLGSNPHLLVLNADKCNVTVVMLRSDYDRKMDDLLNDTTTYLPLNHDPTASIQEKVNKLFSHWQEQHYITNGQGKWYRKYNSVCSKLYGLVKIHKDGYPIRPIVASIGSPTYNLSKMVCKILKNVVGKSHRTIKNATELVKKIRKVRLPANFVLISLDVVSLFTNIPKELVISAVHKRWAKIKKFTNLPKDEFIVGLTMVLDECCFQFNGKFYRQVFGSPMGSPASPVFADLVLEILEEEVIPKLRFRLPFYWRFVDDIITAVPADKVNEVKDAFNKYNKNIQFTVESEKDNRISFLEVLCIRDGRSIKTDWYHKDTWSGRYLNFKSHLPSTYKRNTVTLLTQKIFLLSEPEFYDKNLDLLRETLKRNLYPSGLMESLIKSSREKFMKNEKTPVKEKLPIVAVPYVKGLFEKLKAACKNDVMLVGKGDNSLKKSVFSKLKEPTPKLNQSELVYSIPCSCGYTYVGQTLQFLKTRTGQHRYNIKAKNKDHSALCDHAITSGHTPLWDQTEIVFRESNQKKRDILEMIAIKKTPNCLNKQTDCILLPATYNNII